MGKGCSSRQPREERGVAEEKANGAATAGCLLPQASDLCASDRQSPGSLLCLAALFTTAIFVEERGEESRGQEESPPETGVVPSSVVEGLTRTCGHFPLLPH